MLAFNENGKLTEYEETNFLKVCDSCHHIYKQRVEQQLEGMTEICWMHAQIIVWY